MAELDTETAAEVALWEGRLETLEGMLADNVLIAMHGGTSLQYKNTTDLLRAINYAKGKIRKLCGGVRRPAYVVQNTKGFGQ